MHALRCQRRERFAAKQADKTKPIELGWYPPTHGDTDRFSASAASIPPSLELFDRVAGSAERAGFQYILIPFGTMCWEAYMVGAAMVMRHPRITPLIAARPGYVNPVMLARMIATIGPKLSSR